MYVLVICQSLTLNLDQTHSGQGSLTDATCPSIPGFLPPRSFLSRHAQHLRVGDTSTVS